MNINLIYLEMKKKWFLLGAAATAILVLLLKEGKSVNVPNFLEDLSDVDKLHGPLKIKILEVRNREEGRVLAQTLDKKLIMIDGIPEVYRYDNRELTAIFNRRGNITITRGSLHFIPWEYDSGNLTLPLFTYEKEA